jgi:hypothetical protein
MEDVRKKSYGVARHTVQSLFFEALDKGAFLEKVEQTWAGMRLKMQAKGPGMSVEDARKGFDDEVALLKLLFARVTVPA